MLGLSGKKMDWIKQGIEAKSAERERRAKEFELEAYRKSILDLGAPGLFSELAREIELHVREYNDAHGNDPHHEFRFTKLGEQGIYLAKVVQPLSTLRVWFQGHSIAFDSEGLRSRHTGRIAIVVSELTASVEFFDERPLTVPGVAERILRPLFFPD